MALLSTVIVGDGNGWVCMYLLNYFRVFQMADKNVRKIILATNIAETSVTIPGIVYG